MLRYMLDTNTCIYAMRNQPDKLRQRFNRFGEQLCVSTIVLGELVYGAEKSAKPADNLSAVRHFCSNLDVLAFTERAAHHYGQIRAELERIGRPIGPHDMMIAGHARSEGLTLVTNKEREFARVQGLRIENWM